LAIAPTTRPNRIQPIIPNISHLPDADSDAHHVPAINEMSCGSPLAVEIPEFR
jgi:hypothetical protein